MFFLFLKDDKIVSNSFWKAQNHKKPEKFRAVFCSIFVLFASYFYIEQFLQVLCKRDWGDLQKTTDQVASKMAAKLSFQII
jgi:hypothetical protein